MKTVFKVGMKVYDQLFYPNKKGVVKRIYNDEPDIDFPIEVEFEEKIESYSLKGSCTYAGILTLSTKPYTLQGFEQKAPAPTYEEVIKEARSKGDYYYLPDSLEAPSEELVDATIALLKLLFLKDYYNEGWQPDWTDESYKEILCFETDFHNKKGFKYRFYASKSQPRVLAFKNSEIRERFFKEQEELLEIARPLL